MHVFIRHLSTVALIFFKVEQDGNMLVVSPDAPDSSINKTDSHNITEILLKVAFNTNNLNVHLHCFITEVWRFAVTFK